MNVMFYIEINRTFDEDGALQCEHCYGITEMWTQVKAAAEELAHGHVEVEQADSLPWQPRVITAVENEGEASQVIGKVCMVPVWQAYAKTFG